MRRTTTVLFDLDNTLIPFMPPIKAWAHTFAHHADPHHESAIAQDLIDATLNEVEDPERGLEHVAEAWGLNGATRHATEEAWQAYEAALEPYTGICGLLATLQQQGAKLGIITDAPRERAWHRLTQTNLAQAFQIIITRDDTPKGKQGPEPFQQALRILDVEPHEAVMIGDWPAYDAAWPRRLGMQAILAGWGFEPDHAPNPSKPLNIPTAGTPSEIPSMITQTPPRPKRTTSKLQASLTAFEAQAGAT